MPPENKVPHLVTINGNFYVAWTDGRGRSKRRSLRTSVRAIAQIGLAAFLGDSLKQPGHASPLVSAVLDFYKGRKNPGKRHTTVFAVERLKEAFGTTEVAELTPSLLRSYYATGRPTAASTKGREMTVLRAALRMAQREGMIPVAPFVPVAPPAPPRDRWLTKEEARRLLDACRDDHLRLFVELALSTGARSGALYDLTWQQIWLDRAKIDLNPPGRAQTTKRRPVVPVPPELAQSLGYARIRAATNHVIEFRGERVLSVKKSFAAACRRAGLADVSPHTLRHTAATWMAQAGVPIAMIAGMLGQSIQRTTELYIKHHPDYMRQASEALSFRADFARNPPGNDGILVSKPTPKVSKIKLVKG